MLPSDLILPLAVEHCSLGGHRFESSRKRDKVVTKTDGVSLPTISRFSQEQSGAQTLPNPLVEYDQETLERMRRKLLAEKD